MKKFNSKRASFMLREARAKELSAQIYVYKLVLEYYQNNKESLVEWTRKQRRKQNASLSRLIGGIPGGKKIINILHNRHRLSDEAIYEKHDLDLRIMWTLFKNHPDNFQIIVSDRGVAAIKPFKQDIEERLANAKAKGKEYNPSRDNSLRYQIVAFEGDQEIDPELLRLPTSKYVQSIVVKDGGAGYTSVPTVDIVAAPQDEGKGATAKAQIASGRIVKIEVTNPGSDYIKTPKVVIKGGGSNILSNAQVEPIMADDEERHPDPTVMKTRGGVPSRLDPRAPNIFDLLRKQIGKINNIYITTGAVEREKIEKRSDLKNKQLASYYTERKDAIERLGTILIKLAENVAKSINPELLSTDPDTITKLSPDEQRLAKTINSFIREIDTEESLRDTNISVKIFDRAVRGATGYTIPSEEAAEWLASLKDLESGRMTNLGNLLNELRGEILSYNR